MKILEIVCTYPPYRGGMGNVAKKNTLFLAQAGHEVTVITTIIGAAVECESEANIIVRRLRPLLRVGNAAVLIKLLWLVRAYDSIHLHYPFIGSDVFVIIASVLWRKRLIATYHMNLIAHNGMRRMFFSLSSCIALPLLARFCRAIIITSHDYALHSAIAPWYKKMSERFHEIPCSVDSSRFSPAHNDAHHNNDNLFSILFVGGMDDAHAFKGVETLLNAVKLCESRLGQWELVLVGEGNMRSSYESCAHTLGMANNIRFAGSVSDDDLPSFYRHADVCVLPSLNASEAFGIVLIESLACGTPVIASDLPGVRSVVENSVNGYLVKPGIAQSLADALMRMAADTQKRETMGAHGRKIVEQRYSDTLAAQALNKLFYEL